MTREQLIADIALRANTTPETAGVVLHTVFDTVRSVLRSGDTATLGGLGTWMPESDDGVGLSGVLFRPAQLLAALEIHAGSLIPALEEHEAIPVSVLDDEEPEERQPVDIASLIGSIATRDHSGILQPGNGDTAASDGLEHSHDLAAPAGGDEFSGTGERGDDEAALAPGGDEANAASDDGELADDPYERAFDGRDVNSGEHGDAEGEDFGIRSGQQAHAPDDTEYDLAGHELGEVEAALDDETGSATRDDIVVNAADVSGWSGDTRADLPDESAAGADESEEFKEITGDAAEEPDTGDREHDSAYAAELELEDGSDPEEPADGAADGHERGSEGYDSPAKAEDTDTSAAARQPAAAASQEQARPAVDRVRARVQHELDPVVFERNRDQLYNPPEERSNRTLYIVAAVVTALLLAVILYILFADVSSDPIPADRSDLLRTETRTLTPLT